MRTKRKCAGGSIRPPKRAKTLENTCESTRRGLQSNHALSFCYPEVCSLRQFLVNSLPSSSRARRRKITTHTLENCSDFLDTTSVGIIETLQPPLEEERRREYVAFTQSQQKSTLSSSGTLEKDHMTEIVEFVIWSLFQRKSKSENTPSHVLCQGYQRAPLSAPLDGRDTSCHQVPGITLLRPNESVRNLKDKPWTEILSLLGKNGHAIVRNLLLDCGLFMRIGQGKENLLQISGVPISDLLTDRKLPGQSSESVTQSLARGARVDTSGSRTGGTISFVRNRILYSRPSFNAEGSVRFGMKHIHALNRYPDLTDSKHLLHIMKYIFPRQFGLHNVFTSVVDRNETAQAFKDYTLREHEIGIAEHRNTSKLRAHIRNKTIRTPRRLRGELSSMVQQIRRRHSGCSYTQLLRHYCPIPVHYCYASTTPTVIESERSSGLLQTQLSPSNNSSVPLPSTPQNSERPTTGDSILARATPTANVSAFCRAAVATLLPGDILGRGADGKHNLALLLAKVDQFVSMRRHESLSVHEVSQDLKTNCISWLRPPAVSSEARTSHSDRNKRLELLLEFLYYIFDSILIPLIRSHFYVTESNVHRNHLFYFRHDVWRTVCEPWLTSLRFTIFQSLGARDLRRARQSLLLGYGQVRLLPKQVGARPIINLRRKVTRHVNGKMILGPNINSRLKPCFSALNYERSLQPQKLGSALFSITEAHGRLRHFRDSIAKLDGKRLYFVKMDVKSCFDTIPQEELVVMVQDLLSGHRYQMSKHAEVRPMQGKWAVGKEERPLVKFPQSARPVDENPGLSRATLLRLAQKKHGTVFVDLGDGKAWDSRSLLKLLQEHVQRNVVTIDRKFFKQSRGIPQGSVLSSLLCNFFYGAFENSCLDFLQPEESLLLRLIDDFLLITTNCDHACRFSRVMVSGNPKYGISVNADKSLANFEVKVNQTKVPRLHGSNMFPYCGMAINMDTLEISKFRENKDAQVSNGLTIEVSQRQGLRFHRKVLISLKMQMTAMLLDTQLSDRHCVWLNLHQSFVEAAMKMYRYIRGLPKTKRPRESMVLATWKDVVDLAVKMTRGKGGSSTSKLIDGYYECAVSQGQIHWLAAAALDHVMCRKQTGYHFVLHWAQETMEKYQAGMKTESSKLRELRERSDRVFQRYRY